MSRAPHNRRHVRALPVRLPIEHHPGTLSLYWKKGRPVIHSFTGALPAQPVTSLTVNEYLSQYLAQQSLVVRPATLESYQRVVDRHLRPQLGELLLSSLTLTHISAFHQAIQSKGLGYRSLEYAHHLLVMALDHAVRLELLSTNCAEKVRLPRRSTPRAEMKVWSPAEVRAFLHHSQTHRLYPLFYLALATGLRRGELMALKWAQLDLVQGKLQVTQSLAELKGGPRLTPPKSAASRRSLYLAPDAVAVLHEHQLRQKKARQQSSNWQEHDLVFCTRKGTYLDSANLTRTFHKLSRAAGVPVIRLHDLRHTHASLLALRGIAPKVIADRLGHTNVSFTIQVYTHLYDGQRREGAVGLGGMVRRGRGSISVAPPIGQGALSFGRLILFLHKKCA